MVTAANFLKDRKEALLLHDRLLECLQYSEATGQFTYLKSRARARVGAVADSLDSKGYLRVSIDGIIYSQHRLAWFYVNKTWPEFCIDHIDRNKLNNRLSNLRDVPLADNQWNKNPNRGKKLNLPTGVQLDPRTGKFWARIVALGKAKSLGTYSTAEEASLAYQAAKKQLHIGAPNA